jgi:cellobiose phosphorylase
MTTHGQFTPDGTAFEITSPPPAPWSNVLTNGEFGAVWHDRGGAFAWCGNSNLDRLTRWDQDMVTNPSRRTVFLVDASGIVRTLTPAPVPGGAQWTVTHGIGYTTYLGVCNRYRTRLDVVVLPTMNAEAWYCEVESLKGPSEIRLYSLQEILMGAWPDAHREFHKLFIHTRAVPFADAPKGRALLFEKRLDTRPGLVEHWNTDFPGVLAHTASAAVAGFETDRYRFYGYGGDTNAPRTLLEPPRDGTTGSWGDAMSGLDVALSASPLARVAFVTAYAADDAAVLSLSKDALALTRDEAFAAVRAFWDEQIGALSVESPSRDLDLMASKWLRYQTIAGRLFARCGLYQSSGAFGFRDQLQDCMIFLPYASDRTAAQLTLHLRQQFKAGDVLHWWHPKEGTGPRDHCSDDFLWPIMVAAERYRETGSVKFLKEKVEYRDMSGKPIWDHLRRSIDRSWNMRSERGLPLLGSCDWNDGLSSAGDKGRGESVWVGHFLHMLLLEMNGLAKASGKDGAEFLERAREIRKTVNEHGWDGGWYMQGTNDDGARIGSAQCKEGRIHLNAQTWSVIGRTASDDAQLEDVNSGARISYTDRARQAIAAVKEQLVVDWGVLLLAPAYQTPDSSLGYITRYAPGARENGGVYTHGAVWTSRAARMLGDADLLRHVIFSLLPPVRGRDPRYRAEPYVTPGNIDGPITPTPGRGGWTWYTGSSAWLSRCIFEDFLGVRAVPHGLVLDPMVPADWNAFTVNRPWRGKMLKIEFRRGPAPGLRIADDSMVREFDGNVLPWEAMPSRKKEVRVQVEFV